MFAEYSGQASRRLRSATLSVASTPGPVPRGNFPWPPAASVQV